MTISATQQASSNTDKEAIYLIGGGGLIFLFLLLIAGTILDGSNDLDVQLARGTVLSIKNVGTSKIQIQNVYVNGRPECEASPGLIGSPSKPYPFRDLKVGDLWLGDSPCLVVRVNVKTDRGTYDYDFSR